jgi:hypothetical protein
MVVRERGSKEDLIPFCIGSFDTFQDLCESDDLLFLVLPERVNHINFRQFGEGEFRLNPTNSPVLEFSPSKPINGNLIKVGRVVYSYDADEDMKKLSKSLMMKLRKLSDRLPNSSGFWLMENAKSYENLKFWVGRAKLNPLYVANE